MDSKKIGKLIAKKRKVKQMTQSQLAEQLGVSNKTVSKWETGAGLPDISLLIDLAKELEISVDDLLKGNEETGENRLDHSYIIKKQNYKEFLISQYFQNKSIWFIDLVAVLLLLGGMCCLPLKQYLNISFDMFTKVCLLIAVLLVFMPVVYFIIRLRRFQEYEVQYTIDTDSIIYSGLGEKATYYFQDLILNRYHKIAYLLAKNKILWISTNDIEKIDYPVRTKTTGMGAISFFLLLALITTVICCIVLQLGYIFVLKRFGFEYIHNQVEYMIYLIIIVSIFNVFIVLKMNTKKAFTSLIISLFVIIVLNIFLKYQSSLLVIDSFSPDFSHHAVLKYDTSQQKLFDFHYTYLCFARKSDVIDTNGFVKKKGCWVTDDCYILVYQDYQQEQQVHVSTFGDRGNGISYYYVNAVLDGTWYNLNDGESKTIMKAEKGNITLIQDEEYYFDRNDIEQNGTIALTLFQNDKAKFIIVLNEDCLLEDNGLLNDDGTITIFNIEDMSTVTLYCGTYKEDKEVQEQIDQKMREQAITLVNKMIKLLKNDPQLNNFKDSYQLFHLDSISQDCFTVSKDAYLHFQELFQKSDIEESGEIVKIKIIAGDIEDFYAEITYSGQYSYRGETETSLSNTHYRIKQGKNCYLIATIGYRVPGDIGLKKNEPVIVQDTS